MKYPKFLENHLEEIKAIVESWPVEKKIDEVMAWILQFEKSDYDLALRVLKNLNVIGVDDLNMALGVAYSKLKRHALDRDNKISNENTLYLPIGNDGKSGAMIAYSFRLINGLSSESFLSKDSFDLIKGGKIKNLVLIDDIIATGDQSAKSLKAIAEKARTLGIQNVYLLTAFGYCRGIEKIKETQVADVFSAIEYDESDTVMNLDSSFYDGLSHDKRDIYWESISKYYGGYGYGTIGGLLVFYYNTPNCTINLVWGSKDGWIPLFPRRFDIKISGPETYNVTELLSEIDVDRAAPALTEDCSIYVEGKTEELFIQMVASKNNNFGYQSMNVVSIGPFYSKSLIESLKKYSKTVFFVTDNDLKDSSGYTKSVKDATKDTPLKIIKKVMSYFDRDKIQQSEYFIKAFGGNFIDESISDEKELLSFLENKLIRKAPATYRADNMKELIDNCADEEKMKELVSLFQKEDVEKED